MNSGVEPRGDAPELVKVFCIGLHKTSTTSLANALYTLGFYVGGYFDTSRFHDDEQLQAHVVQDANRFDAVQDMPWPAFYRLLDDTFPGSKFILTIRDPDRWINSVVTHFGDQPIASHEYVYGVPTAAGFEKTYVDHFELHNENVRRYFADRPSDLLVMDIANGDSWPELCGFLDLPEPQWSFPRQNDKSERSSSRYRRKAASVTRSSARRLGVDRWMRSDVIHAPLAYESIHLMCRKLDRVVRNLEDRGSHRAEGMCRLWLEDLLRWTAQVEAAGSPAATKQALRQWQLADAWQQLRPVVRQWTADLRDEGGGVFLPDGRAATAPVRKVLDLGDRYWHLVAPEVGLGDSTAGSPVGSEAPG